MFTIRQAAAVALIVALGGAPFVHGAEPSSVGTQPGAAQLALANLAAKSGKTLSVTSPAFPAGGDIPFENTQYRGNVFPGLAWSHGPHGTLSYAVIMQDPDALYRGVPILHWTLFNVPLQVTRLEAALGAPPAGASYGPNIRGPNHAYMGPHTPPGPKHHYHFQIFALDAVLPPEDGADYAALTGAMKGHVLASGELVGLARADPNATPPAK